MSESGSALVSEERTPHPDGSLGTGIFVSVIIALILSIVPFVAVLLIPRFSYTSSSCGGVRPRCGDSRVA